MFFDKEKSVICYENIIRLHLRLGLKLKKYIVSSIGNYRGQAKISKWSIQDFSIY